MRLAKFWNDPEMAYTPDGQLLAGGGTSRNVRIWKTSDGVEVSILYHPGQVSSLAVSPDGYTLATGLCEASQNSVCTRGTVWLWDLLTGASIQRLSDVPDWVEGVAYSLDGSLVVAGARDGASAAHIRLLTRPHDSPLLPSSGRSGRHEPTTGFRAPSRSRRSTNHQFTACVA